MGIKLERFIILKEKDKCFIAIDHVKKKYKIIKNDYSTKFKVNDDKYIYYTIVKKGMFSVTINPISHEEYLRFIGEVS